MNGLYIFDLDGTLANIEHRLHFIQQEPKDWKGFFAACGKDRPIQPVVDTYRRLRSSGAELWIWSGRSKEVWAETCAWLIQHGLNPDHLMMRQENDHRPDWKVKAQWASQLSESTRHVLVAVFEDRSQVVDMWRAAGITCFQVADGEF